MIRQLAWVTVCFTHLNTYVHLNIQLSFHHLLATKHNGTNLFYLLTLTKYDVCCDVFLYNYICSIQILLTRTLPMGTAQPKQQIRCDRIKEQRTEKSGPPTQSYLSNMYAAALIAFEHHSLTRAYVQAHTHLKITFCLIFSTTTTQEFLWLPKSCTVRPTYSHILYVNVFRRCCCCCCCVAVVCIFP